MNRFLTITLVLVLSTGGGVANGRAQNVPAVRWQRLGARSYQRQGPPAPLRPLWRSRRATGPQVVSLQANAAPMHRWEGPCSSWKYGEFQTPATWAADPAKGVRQTRRLITCVFEHWAPGNVSKALYVADRESSDYPWAQNPSSLCSGLFQHVLSAWPGRVRFFLWRGWFPHAHWPVSVFDPRANSIVAAKMVAAGGWAPWAT